MKIKEQSTIAYLDELLEVSKRDIPSFKTLKLYSGQDTFQQFTQAAKVMPALLVSLRGIHSVINDHEGFRVTASIQCFVLVRNGIQQAEAISETNGIEYFVDSILAILSEMESILPKKGTKLYQKYPAPVNLKADPLHYMSDTQTSIWRITWQQAICLGSTEESLENLNAFLQANI